MAYAVCDPVWNSHRSYLINDYTVTPLLMLIIIIYLLAFVKTYSGCLFFRVKLGEVQLFILVIDLKRFNLCSNR